jgi:hypothetical protein
LSRSTRLALAARVRRPFLVVAALVLVIGGLVLHAVDARAPMVRATALAAGAAPAGSTGIGPVPATQQVPLEVILPSGDPSGLQTLLGELYDPASPEYHHWLAPGQFQQAFGPSSADVTAVESWLHRQGLTATSLSGFAVDVSAPESQVAAALGTGFDRYRSASGHVGYLAHRAPLVPSSLLGGPIQSILGLDTLSQFVPETESVPQAVTGGLALHPDADGLTPCAAAQGEADQGGSTPVYYTLDALGAGYGFGSLLADGENGRGQSVAVYELASHSTSNVSTYLSCFGLTNTVTTAVVDTGGGGVTPGTEEADADIEQVATQAPGASVISYEGPNSTAGAYDTWRHIVDDDAAKVVSTSWGECEPLAQTDGSLASFPALFAQAASQGQTVLAASGDSGSADCDTAPGDSTALEVDYPASDVSVTGVGGTTFFGPGDEQAWTAGGGGISRYVPDPSWQPIDLTWPTAANACAERCRAVPDLSSNAGIGMVIYSYVSTASRNEWTAVGGTSLAAPLVAGLVADRNGGCITPTGQLAPILYPAVSGLYGAGLTDITTGENDFAGTNSGAYPATAGYDDATGLGSPLAAGLSCPEVTGVGSGAPGSTVTVTGLGLEHATVHFGPAGAQVLASTATSASVVVPQVGGTMTVSATGALGTGTQTASFTSTVPAQHGYWLVGGDGGIFTFGSAQFHGSTGSLTLQRPVVGITPTVDRGGYWLVASDGGIFAFADAGFYGSIPGLGIAPAGAGGAHHLNAPIVGMVPSTDGAGYFMVASDGGVFAFGDARFAGSCPGIGGCAGPAVAVMPDATGNGYWLVTATGNVYAFGDAASHGAPGNVGVPVTSAVRTPDGNGYWILFANGAVSAFGDAANLGGLGAGAAGGLDPATAIFTTADGAGYWVATADGAVYPFGDAPNDGSMAGQHLNAPIIAATGW